MDAEGATQITRVEQSPSDIAWSPDGKPDRVLDAGGRAQQLAASSMPKSALKPAKWTEAPRIVERLNYRRDRQGFTDNGFRHIFVVPADRRHAAPDHGGNFDHNGNEWTPDGRSDPLQRPARRGRGVRLARVGDLRGRRRRPARPQLTTRRVPTATPVSPDGKRIAYTGYDWTDAPGSTASCT
jgi:hypothetical protein